MKKLSISVAIIAVSIISGCSRGPTQEELAAQAEASRSAEDASRAAALAEQYHQCVQAVLDADAALDYKTQPEVQAVKMRQIDTTLCPADFRQAYEAHIYAWENEGKINIAQKQLNSDENINETIAASIFAGITGSDATPINDHIAAENELKRLRAISSQDISDTYEQVKITSLKYGATLPAQ